MVGEKERMMKLQKNPAVKIIKRQNRSEPDSTKNRQQDPEPEIKKTVELWVYEFKRRRH